MTPNYEDAIAIINKAWTGRKDAPDYPDYDDINTAIYSLEKAVKTLGILKRYIHCWKSSVGKLCMGLNERDKYDELGESKVDYDDWSEWAVELPEEEYEPIKKWLEEKQ